MYKQRRSQNFYATLQVLMILIGLAGGGLLWKFTNWGFLGSAIVAVIFIVFASAMVSQRSDPYS